MKLTSIREHARRNSIITGAREKLEGGGRHCARCAREVDKESETIEYSDKRLPDGLPRRLSHFGREKKG